ncbi:TIGR03086 family protein [Pseudofrankia asymbiotica]|uniref:TIGR03086 family protein n=1 Tax=Pseudofrankia asymbiotica TaxID=1834516 RepID=A0A1V2I8L4_9ACTN|nr:TIGR03086 family protein [Pseudofrankia asymbiotica]
MDIRELDRRALALTGEMVGHVTADQLTLPTPCPDWTLYGLLRHLVSQNEGFAAAARGEGEALPVWRSGDLGDNPHAAYQASAELVSDAFTADDALDRPFALPEVIEGITFPGRVAISFHLVDYVVHAWDVAATIGAPWEPDEDLTAAALRVAEIVPADGRGPGAAFERATVVPDGVPARHRLLGLLGRDPSWKA